MISITTQVSGPQIAAEMYSDEEETARFLGKLADLVVLEDDVQSLGVHIADHTDGDKVADFLRALAGAIEEAQA